MSEKNNKGDFGVIGNSNDDKMQYFSSANISNNTIMNYAKKKAEILCRGKWNDNVPRNSDSIVCLNEVGTGSIPKGKTYIVKNGDVVIDPEFSSPSDGNYDVFVMNGDLIIDEVHKPITGYRTQCLAGELTGDGEFYDEGGSPTPPPLTHYSCTTYKELCDSGEKPEGGDFYSTNGAEAPTPTHYACIQGGTVEYRTQCNPGERTGYGGPIFKKCVQTDYFTTPSECSNQNGIWEPTVPYYKCKDGNGSFQMLPQIQCPGNLELEKNLLNQPVEYRQCRFENYKKTCNGILEQDNLYACIQGDNVEYKTHCGADEQKGEKMYYDSDGSTASKVYHKCVKYQDDERCEGKRSPDPVAYNSEGQLNPTIYHSCIMPETRKFVFTTGGFIDDGNLTDFGESEKSAMKNNNYNGKYAAIGSLIKGNFIVNGKIKGSEEENGKINNKYFIYGKISTRDTFNDLASTFAWRCVNGIDTNNQYCPYSTSGWKNPYDGASLVIIDQNYPSPFFNEN